MKSENLKKGERLYLASEVMKELGYTGRADTLRRNGLEIGVDMIKVTKKNHPMFFKQLFDLKPALGFRAGHLILLYESGVNKLIMGSKKPIGVMTRKRMADEVLPSIKETGFCNTMFEFKPVYDLGLDIELNQER